MVEYTLYKEPISLDTLAIVQYLHANGIDMQPTYIVERNHNPGYDLPYIITNEKLYNGLNEVVKFYEQNSGITDLLKKSTHWKSFFPNYRIHG